MSTGTSAMKRECNVVALRGRRVLRNRMLGTTGSLLLLGALSLHAAAAEEMSIQLPDKGFPESVTSTSDGTIYTGSFNNGGGGRGKTRRHGGEMVTHRARGARA